MSITFKKAPVVKEGDPITSAQHNALAQAFNDRILSGLGDCAWRIIYYAFGAMRQIRNPSFAGGGPIGLWPYADEWLRIDAYLNPRKTGAEWPLTPPGEQEGVNLNAPIAAFVNGNDRVNLDPEDVRLESVPLWLPKPGGFGPPENDAEFWTLAKYQRGAFDPNANVFYAPALTAAQSHEVVRYGALSRYMKSYGGFLPAREECPDGCGDATVDQPETPRWKVVFTPLPEAQKRREEAGLDPLPVKQYAGFCPAGTPGATDTSCGRPIAAVSYGKFYYRIFAWDNAGNLTEIDRLSTADYIEGPYRGGGVISHDQGEQINQALNYFLKNFRGSLAQRVADDWDPEETSFDFEKFFAGQYFLSPARGQAAGEGIEAVYPAFQIKAPSGGGKVTAGTKATNIDGGQTFHQIAEGFVFAGAYVSATGLKSPVTIEAHAGDVPIHSFNLLPDAQKMAFGIRHFDQAQEQTKVSFKLATDAEFEAGSGLYFEVAELVALKPSVQDAYLVIRLASTHGGDGAHLDEDGIDLPDPHVISDTYFHTGCIVNGGASGLATISENSIVNNPIHEALRQLIVDNARLAQKDGLVGYEVVNGKSVLYYKRYAYGLNNEAFDIFAGLGPSPDPVSSGQIKPGYRYLVKTGSVIHDGKTIAANQTFTGKLNVKSFEALNNAVVFEYDGIRLTAPQQGTSNRWVLFFSLNGYRPVESSIWKEELYDNTIVLHQRGHTLSAELSGHPPFPPKRDLNAHFTLGQKHALISEAPSGYIYAKGINGRRQLEREAQKDFYRSCQIYQAPYEIESIVAKSDDVVKVTLKGRLRHTPGAPAAIENDPEKWGFLDHEKYRTDENAVMDYLRYRALGKHCKETSEAYVATDGEGNPVIDPETGDPVKVSYPFQIGDLAANNNVDVFGSDRPKGCCLPRSYFVRLVPEVYEDNNPDQDTADTGVDVEPYCQMEFYLRAFCGGFVDEKASLDLCDTDSPLMDYTFQNLCFDAISQKWLDILPVKLKPSAFGGHGPLPRTQMYAEVFNNFSKCINKLDKVRVDLPLAVQSRLAQFTLGLQPFLPAYGDPPPDGPCACPPSGPFNVCDSSIGNYDFASAPLRPPISNWRDLCAEGSYCEWTDGFGSAYASIDARVLPETAGFGGFGPSLMCEGGQYRFPAVAEKRVGVIRVNPDQDELLAVPESIRDMLTDERSLGVIARMVKRRNWTLIDQANGEREQCRGTFWNVRNDAVNDFLKIGELEEMSEECVLLTGSLEKYLPELPESVLTWFNTVNCRKGRGASSSVYFQPANNPVLFVQVPLSE